MWPTFWSVFGQAPEEFNNTLIVTLTEFGRTIKQNSGLGTEQGSGSAIFMGGGLLKKSQIWHFFLEEEEKINILLIILKKILAVLWS